MSAYYNEIDPKAAAWLRELIAQGHIAPGEVDTRSILEVRADDIKGFTQCHFFAGVGVWSFALRLAGWPDDRPVWTGSCPCQPFSVAGKGEGHEDERHLWPAFFGLIREQGPLVVFGEQVADGDGYAWLDDVGDDLEGIAYTVGSVCPASCGFGSPDERQRMYWVAHASGGGAERHGFTVAGEARGGESEGHQRQRLRDEPRHGGDAGRVALADGERGCCWPTGGEDAADAGLAGEAGGLADTGHAEWRPLNRPCDEGRRDLLRQEREEGPTESRERGADVRPGPLNGFWRAADWLFCTDGKWRPVEPGTFPLDTGVAGRLVRLRAYGNAVNAEAAAEFVRAYMSLNTVLEEFHT